MVRGGVGGDLSVVFGEEFPELADGAQADRRSRDLLNSQTRSWKASRKTLPDKLPSDQAYDMTAAAAWLKRRKLDAAEPGF